MIEKKILNSASVNCEFRKRLIVSLLNVENVVKPLNIPVVKNKYNFSLFFNWLWKRNPKKKLPIALIHIVAYGEESQSVW